MNHLILPRRAGLALIALATAGCMDRQVIAPVAPSGPRADLTATEPAPRPGEVQICKSGPAGTYDFSARASAGTLPMGGAFTIAAGECRMVWEGSSTVKTYVEVIETNLPEGIGFDRIQVKSGLGSVDNTARKVVFTVNRDHGGVATFYNVETFREKITICKEGAPGTYSFEITADGGKMLLGSAFSIPSGECRTPWEGTSTATSTVEVTEVLVADGARFDRVELTSGTATVDNATRSVTFKASSDHGGSATFFNEVASRERITVCKVGPTGSYNFSVTATGGNLLEGSGPTIAAGACKDVWEGISTAPTTVTVAEVDLPVQTRYNRLEVNSGLATVDDPSRSVTFTVNSDHGGSATFFNEADIRRRVSICKDGPAGSYSFSATASSGDLLLGGAFSLAAGECKEVWEGTSTTLSSVTVSEVDLPAGINFDRVIVNSGSGVVDGPNRSVTFSVSRDVGAAATFYNIEEPIGAMGCTPGYWKNHPKSWKIAASNDFDAFFEVDFFKKNITLEDAVYLNGGGVNALARHAASAALNIASPGVDYPIPMAELIKMVQDAYRGVVPVEMVKDQLDKYNNMGCPLN